MLAILWPHFLSGYGQAFFFLRSSEKRNAVDRKVNHLKKPTAERAVNELDGDMLDKLKFLLAVCVFGVLGSPSDVSAGEGLSHPWQMGLQQAYSPVMEKVNDYHNLILVIQVGIVLLVLAVLGFVMIRFNAKRNPVPSKTTHNTILEVVWTALPIVILVIIAIPGLRLLYFHDSIPDYDMTLKVTGHQWYWTYNYPDHGDFTFDSILVPDDELEEGQPRMLTVDNRIVLPVDSNIQIVVTSDDVIHDWAIPSLGMKVDATPGRINERWVRINEEGTYYGMCSELCGVNHGYMPIEIKAVSKEAFAEWVEQAKEEFAQDDTPSAKVVQATSTAVAQ
jgi:cytochrome c oxidase subunit 2